MIFMRLSLTVGLTALSRFSFFNDLARFWKEDYSPKDDDIVHCRARTIGMTETVFKTGGHILRFIDVGGQKSERRKWINFFQDVTSVLFLVSLSGYDQCLIEDRDAVSGLFACFVVESHIFEYGARSLWASEADGCRPHYGRTKCKTRCKSGMGYATLVGSRTQPW